MIIKDLISRGISLYTPLKVEVAVGNKDNGYKLVKEVSDDGVETVWSEDGRLLEAVLHFKMDIKEI